MQKAVMLFYNRTDLVWLHFIQAGIFMANLAKNSVAAILQN